MAVDVTTEDDFEMGHASMHVFVRVGDRLLGFLAGCILVAGLWLLRGAL